MGIYIDIAICATFLIALIFGAILGMCRQFSRPLVGLFSIAGAAALVWVLYPLFATTSPMVSFISAVSAWFKKDMYVTTIADAEGLSQTMSGSYLSILSGISDKMFANMQTRLDGTGLPLTIGNYFGKIIVNIIVEFVLWLALYLAIKYLLFGVKYLLKKISSVIVFKSIDKVLGIVWSVALTYLIVIGILLTLCEIVIARFLGGFAPTFAQFINGTTVLKFLHNTNVMGSFIAQLLGMPLVSLT